MKLLLLGISLAILQPATAQKMPSDYFEEGESFVSSHEYTKAIVAYRYIVDNHRNFEYYPEAFYNLAYTHLLANNLTQANVLFRTILEMDVDDKKQVGGDIMASPYANFRHQSSRWLSEIYYRQNRFDSALYFLQLADTVYPYNHFCGNAFAENDLNLALTYADLYNKLGQQDKAISALLKVAFTNDLADNSEAVRQLKTLLRKQRVQIKTTLDTALRNLYTKPSGKGEPEYYFQFLGREIKAPYVWSETTAGEEAVRKAIKKSVFYTMLTASPPGRAKKEGRRKN